LWRSRPSRRKRDAKWREFRRISDQVVTREDFLERRRISSKVDSGGSMEELWRNLKSEELGIGSPQGNVLSPILFACFINDVGCP
jgi:hypothetical protein